MARKIVITSGKGGVGKTTVCANLGYSLAKLGCKVLMLDIDIGLNNLDVVMGVENKIVYDIIDVLEGNCRPKQALIQDFFENNLYILPSNHIYYSNNLEANKIVEVLNMLENDFDYILLDCPAGIENGFKRAISCVTEGIIVTTPHLSALRDGDKVITLLKANNIDCIGLIINRARGDLMLEGDMLNIETIKEFLDIDVLGVVPEDDNISKQLLVGGILNDSNAKTSFGYIANKLNNGAEVVYDCTKKYKGMFGSVKRNLKKIL